MLVEALDSHLQRTATGERFFGRAGDRPPYLELRGRLANAIGMQYYDEGAGWLDQLRGASERQ